MGKLHDLSGRCRELHRFGRLFPLGKGQCQAGDVGRPMLCRPGKAPLPEIPALFRVEPVVLHDVPRGLFTAANDLLFGAEGVIIFPGTAAVLHGFAVDGYTWQIVKRTKRVLGFGQFDNFRRAFVNIHPFISGQLLVMCFDRLTLHPAADVYNQAFSTKVNRRDDEMLPAPHRVCPAGHFLPGAAPMRAVTARIVLKINLPLHLRSTFPYSFLYCSAEGFFRQPTLFR